MTKKVSTARAICTQCGLDCRRVATIMMEKSEGDLAAVFVIGRQFIHIAENGQRKICHETLPNPWLMTLCGTDELTAVRQDLANKAVKWQVGMAQLVGAFKG